jgi:hypothetical protein
MTHLYKVGMQFADVFISRISDTEIDYEVRSKDVGLLVEPRRSTKYIINDATKMCHFDNREIPLVQFQHIYNVLL